MWNGCGGEIVCRFEYEAGKRRPYVEEVLAYSLGLDLSQNEGFLEYNGYYYVENSDLPQRHTMNLYKIETEPVWVNMDGDTIRTKYNFAFDYVIDVEIYRREQYEDTSQPCLETESEEGSICFFPTHRERIWFRILDKKECSGRSVMRIE